ncbi:hypothetical protein ACX3UX_06920 [Staphylococcus epidermidis]|uniref:hypothetical protein n=1 Tax=Staphylococcus epidermidis TaxID=1282 RepID=UPI00128C3806|nr:hypothetical protein [Staphylococcus epidermidis]MBF2164834.1 hypothetical protein [Staphylococcus epidermidis]
MFIATIGYFIIALQLVYLIGVGKESLINTSFIAFQIIFVFLLDSIYQRSVYSYNYRNTDSKASSDLINLESAEIKVISGFFALLICFIAYLNQIGTWNQGGFKQKGIVTLLILFVTIYICVFNSRSTFYNQLNKDPLLFFEDRQHIRPIIMRLLRRLVISIPIVLVAIFFVYKLIGIN